LGQDLIIHIINKSANWLGALFFVWVLMPLNSTAEALQPAVAAEIGVSVMRFNYTEFADVGTTLNREFGGIPGMTFRFAQRFSSWEGDVVASYHYGRADYTGLNSNSVPYNTRTDEGVGDLALRLGCWFGDRIMPYAGLGYRRWDRNIRPANLGGLFESYRWNYAWLGAKVMAYQQGASNLMLDIGWIKPIEPVLYVDAYSARLNPEGRDGLRLMLTSHMVLDENTMLIVEPYYEYWRLGRSASVSSGGFTIYEPASETKNLGMNLRLGRRF
jgi:hypothetical protein